MIDPLEYIPNLYMHDFNLISKGRQHGMLCGFIIIDIFKLQLEDDHKNKFYDLDSFFSCCYVLNLLNQGLYTYGITNQTRVLPFLDIRDCPSCHGGTFTPGGIIRCIKNLHLKDLRAIGSCEESLESTISNYTKYFFNTYLPDIIGSNNIRLLIKNLTNDVDCPEFGSYLNQAYI